MKKIINYFKNLIRKFNSRPKCAIRYTFNRMYQDDIVLQEFIQERWRISKSSSTSFIMTWDNFPDNQYGKVETVKNGKVLEKAVLMKNEDFVYWIFLNNTITDGE